MTYNRLYHVTLTDEERTTLLALTKTGKATGRIFTRAHILLLADETQASDEELAALLHTSSDTVQRTRRKFVEGNLDGALHEKRRPGARVKFTPEQERQVALLACSDAPEGRAVWTLRLLADRLVEMGMVDAISHETVRQALKKMTPSPGSRRPMC